MLDIHTHILPGVDDGPSGMEESVRIIEKGMGCGIKIFVLTPHIKDDSDWKKIGRINEAFSLLKNECETRRLDVRLVPGAELFLTSSLPERVEDNATTIISGAKKYALVELPFYQLPVYTEDVLFRMLVKKIIPVIAHPERCVYVDGKGGFLKNWIGNGIMAQVNSGSLDGQYGARVKGVAMRLIKNRFVHFLGSDVHSINDGFSSFSKAINHMKFQSSI